MAPCSLLATTRRTEPFYLLWVYFHQLWSSTFLLTCLWHLPYQITLNICCYKIVLEQFYAGCLFIRFRGSFIRFVFVCLSFLVFSLFNLRIQKHNPFIALTANGFIFTFQHGVSRHRRCVFCLCLLLLYRNWNRLSLSLTHRYFCKDAAALCRYTGLPIKPFFRKSGFVNYV